MAEEPSPPSPELTEEQKQRAEANRLRALAKRKALVSQQSASNPQTLNPCWRSFKSRKISDPLTHNAIPPKPEPVLPERFGVRLEICSPDSFSVSPCSVLGFTYPGRAECFRRLEFRLSNVMLTHYTQIHGGLEASVYKLRDYDAVLRCLKNYKDIEVEEIPWTTYNVLEKFSHSYTSGRWIPCRPEHLPDEKVEELIQKLPRKLLETLLPFQLDGLKFGLRRGGRCLIADEMGLGKTLQAIAIASCFADEGSILVVCPAILRYTWAEELERWLPSYLPSDIHLVFGHRNNPVHLTRRPRIVVISYKMLHMLRESMLSLEWPVVIIDESHHIRCSKKKSEPREIRAALDVASKAKRIVLLSGTPSLSRPFDIYHQINMLWPGLLGKNKFEFAKTYCSVRFAKDSQGKTFQDFSRGTRLEELNVLLRQTLMIRRLKEHLLVQLPPKRRQIIRLSLKKSDILYAKNAEIQGDAFSTSCADEIEEDNDKRGHKSQTELSYQVLGIAKVFGFLEWLALHPTVSEADDSDNCEMNASSQKMIVFAHHHKVLDKVQEFLCDKRIGFVRIDGNTLDSDRQSAVQSFRSSKEVKIAMIGIQVGYAGLDLSVAQNVAFLELPKDPNSLLQAEDRAHRRGQNNAVNIYIFCAKDTSDESRWRRLNRSAQRVSSTIDGKYNAVQEIKVDSVLSLGSTAVCQSFNSENGAAPSLETTGDEKMQQCETHNDDSENAAATSLSCSGDEKIQECEADNAESENAAATSLECSGDAKMQECESDNADSENATATSLECSGDEKMQECEADNAAHVKGGDEKCDAAAVIPEASKELTQTQNSIPVHSLRFAVSQYTGRVHLCACMPGEGSTPRSLSENFRPEEIQAGPSETSSVFAKENPVFQLAITSFVNEWKNLKRMEKRKLFGKPLQIPLALELLRISESSNHDSKGLLKGGSRRRHTPLYDMSYPLSSNAVVKEVHLCDDFRKTKPYIQFWTLTDEPLCKLCQNPCLGINAKKPKDFLDLFCSIPCYEEYRSRTSGKFLREELFEIERGVCSNCQLDCHKLVQHLKPLTLENREKYIEREAPQLAKNKKLMDKLIREPTDGNAWHADHKVAVYLGGGECKVENMRTLCVVCHAEVTAVQTTERALARKLLRKAMANIRKTSKGQAKNTDKDVPAIEEKAEDDELLVDVRPGNRMDRIGFGSD